MAETENLEHLRPCNPKPKNLYKAINRIVDELTEINKKLARINKKLAKTHRKIRPSPKKAI